MPTKGWSALRNRAERGPSANFIRLKDGESVRVRFLVKGDEDVVFFRQHYIDKKYRICEDETEDGSGRCRYCDESENKPSDVYAFNVLDRKDGKVKILQLATSHAVQILEYMDEYGSITDRDYKITRRGQASATRYTFVGMKEAPWDAVEKQAYKDKYDLDAQYDPEARNPKQEEKSGKKKRVTDETKKQEPAKSKKSAPVEAKSSKVTETKKKKAPADEEMNLEDE